MNIRKYNTADCAEIIALFYNTVHTINIKDYTKSQVDAWTGNTIDEVEWNKSLSSHTTFVTEENNVIVGFGDMDGSGYIYRLFSHKDYQNKGIATKILSKLEHQAKLHGIFVFTTHASITAKPFFENRGYCVVAKNKVFRNNVELVNFIMKKQLL